MQKQRFNFSQARAYSAQYGLYISILWIVSFVCTMNAIQHPLLSIVGQITAFLSLFTAIRLITAYSKNVQPLNIARKLWLSWSTCAFATLMTTFAQYVYLRYIDKGSFLNAIREVFNDPAYKEILEQQMQGIGADKALEILSATTYSQFAMQFLFFNICISFVFTILMAVFSKTK